MLGSLERQAVHLSGGRGDFSFPWAWGTPNALLPLRPGLELLGHSCRQYLNLPAWGYLRSVYCVLKFNIFLSLGSDWLVQCKQVWKLGVSWLWVLTTPRQLLLGAPQKCCALNTGSGICPKGTSFWSFLCFTILCFYLWSFCYFFLVLDWKSYYHRRATSKYLA